MQAVALDDGHGLLTKVGIGELGGSSSCTSPRIIKRVIQHLTNGIKHSGMNDELRIASLHYVARILLSISLPHNSAIPIPTVVFDSVQFAPNSVNGHSILRYQRSHYSCYCLA